MQKHLNVHRRATILRLQMVRCGAGANFEVFEYQAPDQRTSPPRNSDIGGHHVAFYVDDLTAAVQHLRANGVAVFGPPTSMTSGPSAGETWVYFLAPWGLQLELVSYPNGMAYEKGSQGAIWNPARPAD